MVSHEYAVTIYALDDVLATVAAHPAEEAPSMVYCDADGLCFFDDAPNPYLAAILEMFNARGEEGWALVQVLPRQQDMICFWRRERAEE